MKTARWFGIHYLSFCLWLLLFPPWMWTEHHYALTASYSLGNHWRFSVPPHWEWSEAAQQSRLVPDRRMQTQIDYQLMQYEAIIGIVAVALLFLLLPALGMPTGIRNWRNQEFKDDDGGEKVKPSSSKPPLPPDLARAQAALMGKPLGRPVTAPEQVASSPTTPATAPKPDLRDSRADRESANLAAAAAALSGKSMEEIAKAGTQEPPAQEVTQPAEYREGKMGSGLKCVGRFIPLIVLLGCAAAGIAFWFHHAHEVKLREAEAATAKEEYAKSVVVDMVNTWPADDHWEKSLSSPGESSQTLYTIEFEKALIHDRPLIVFGIVNDVSKSGQSENSIISISTDTRANLSPALRLSLLSPPEIANKILGQTDRSSEMFVFAAKINSVEKISMPSSGSDPDYFLAHGVLYAAKPIDVYEPPAESRQPNQ